MKPSLTCLAHRPAVCRDRATTLQLLVTIRPPRLDTLHRPDLNLALSLDRSGSMSGEPMQRAKEAAIGLVECLQTSDIVSAVAFHSHFQVLIEAQGVKQPKSLTQKLRDLEAGGSTDLFQGFSEAAHQIREWVTPTRLSRVIILSDGQANQGVTDPQQISQQVKRWFEIGVTTTTVGLGNHYNEDLLSAMADAGGGNFYHVQHSTELEPLFQVELNGLSNTFARSVSLQIAPKNGVELLRILNPLELGERGELKLADLVYGCPIDIVLELSVPAQEKVQDLLECRLEWTELESGQTLQTSEGFQLPVVPHGQLSEFPPNHLVSKKWNLQLAAGALKRVKRLLDERNYGQAEGVLKETLRRLQECRADRDIQFYQEKFLELLERIRRGETSSVRKASISTGRSLSLGSFGACSWIREFSDLPPKERTPEKFQELMRRNLDLET